MVQRGGKFTDVGVADGTARPQGADQLPFGAPPLVGDALYLGFEEAIAKLMMQVDDGGLDRRAAPASNPEDPPLRWEVSAGDGKWEDAEVLEDLTGGFNYGSGTVELQCPPRSASSRSPASGCAGCAAGSTTGRARGATTTYTHPPEIYSITAAPVGALLRGVALVARRERGARRSDGTPGQAFRLRNAPVLKPAAASTLEIQDPESGDWERWELRENFVDSTRVRAPLHARRRLGRDRVRPGDPRDRRRLVAVRRGARRRARSLRMSRYRYGGGRAGNVAAGTLDVLRSPIPGVDTVTNPRAAIGGVDAEPLEHARQRASMEIRTRYRAVTAEDFEFLAGEASPRVARAVCLAARRRRAGRRCRSSRTSTPPTASSRYEELVPDERAAAGRRRVPRRAAPDRHQRPAAAVPVPRAVGRASTSRPRRSPTRRAWRRTSRTRSTRT